MQHWCRFRSRALHKGLNILLWLAWHVVKLKMVMFLVHVFEPLCMLDDIIADLTIAAQPFMPACRHALPYSIKASMLLDLFGPSAKHSNLSLCALQGMCLP